jgi:tellurite resistance protein TerC
MNELWMMEVMEKPFWMWAFFLTIVLALVVFDLAVTHRHPRALSVKDSLRMSTFYICVSLAFSVFVWHYISPEAGKDFITGYIVEQTLSMDNVFVISMIFTFFAIPRENQYRVLFWGIVGVVVLRGIMIAAGSALVHRFEWTLYIFAIFLILTGIKMLLTGDKPVDIEKNPLLKFLRRNMRITKELHGQKFFVKQEVNGKKLRFATPLFIALIVIEFADLIFAVDSVPAIFAITKDTYIVYTSNIFAILGLRALYFSLSAMVHRFEYLKYSLSILLVFIGSKIFIADALGLEKFPQSISLSLTFLILGTGVVYSLYKTRHLKH